MDAVFRLADRISVLVDGRVIATGAPAAIRSDADVHRGLSRRREGVRLTAARCSRSRGCTPATARARCCSASTSRVARGRGRRRCSAATAWARPRWCARSWACCGRAPGAIAFAGQRDRRAGAPTASRARGIALVPEGRQVFPNLTVRENLSPSQRRRATARATVDAGARARALPGARRARRSHLGNQLSGGEQQMLAIGRALVTNPQLLILDEATEGLAPLVREEIWRCLARAARRRARRSSSSTSTSSAWSRSPTATPSSRRAASPGAAARPSSTPTARSGPLSRRVAHGVRDRALADPRRGPARRRSKRLGVGSRRRTFSRHSLTWPAGSWSDHRNPGVVDRLRRSHASEAGRSIHPRERS